MICFHYVMNLNSFTHINTGKLPFIMVLFLSSSYTYIPCNLKPKSGLVVNVMISVHHTCLNNLIEFCLISCVYTAVLNALK